MHTHAVILICTNSLWSLLQPNNIYTFILQLAKYKIMYNGVNANPQVVLQNRLRIVELYLS